MRLIACIALIAMTAACDKPEGTSVATQAKPASGLVRDHAGEMIPDVTIVGDDGKLVPLSNGTGAPLLVNLWASWCAPCIEELPTLRDLAARDGAPNVLAISQDIAAQDSVRAFLEEHEVAALGATQDPDMALTEALNVQVMPTTVLYDAEGREVWRYVGDLDWTGDEAARLLAEAG